MGWSLGSETQPVRVFSLADKNAASVCQNLADACMGTFFFSRAGAPTLYARNYNSMTTHNIDQAVLHREIGRGQPWEMIANDITVVAHRSINKLASDIWFLPDPVYIAASGTATVRATYDPAVEISVRSKKAFVNANGTGAELTSSFSVSQVMYNAYTDFTITNNSSSNGYLTELILRGRCLADRPVEYNDTDATSKATYNPRFSPWTRLMSIVADGKHLRQQIDNQSGDAGGDCKDTHNDKSIDDKDHQA